MCPPPLPPPARATRLPFLASGLVFASLSAVLLVLVSVRWSPLMSLDTTVAEALHRRAVTEPTLVHANRVLTDWVWDPWTMRVLTAVVVIALWWRGSRLLAGWVAATSLLATLVQQGLKAAVGRERPQWLDPVDSAHYAAFPSGHVMTAAVTCGLLVWLLRLHDAPPALWWGSAVIALVSVAGVAFTRVYLGVHWLSDVVGGVLLGGTVVTLSVAGHTAYTRRLRRQACDEGSPL
ncbi:phosphatase PAP2 family protein [Streptomyces sp. HB132]|uniref:phosphatase PAP2 family protein n=1 Tax=Streptomyces sp. HB132 TaxID=767388 RepID=UPI001961B3AD|nr:phosphatase PAP2 family protein [Streptomyces sp. HB132]MBM7442906.1 undecaprenyl-diphosphatase [Streptomyces sp. HB132]